MPLRDLAGVVAAVFAASCVATATAAAAEAVASVPAEGVVTIAADVSGAEDLAASMNGQTVACIDAARRAVVAIDPFEPTRRREVIAAAVAPLPEPVAVGWLSGDVVAVVCRGGDGCSLRTFRIRPDAAVDPAEPLQSTPIRAADPGPVAIAVSRARNWLVIGGLVGHPVVRGIVAGGSVRLIDEPRGRAEPQAGRTVAVTVGPADELVLFTKPPSGNVLVSFLDPAGRELMRLDTGLREVRDAAFGRGSGELFVLGGEPGGGDQAEGLWRLDATLRDGMQAIRPTRLVALPAPRAIASVTERALVVVHGSGPRRIVRIDPTAGETTRDEEQR